MEKRSEINALIGLGAYGSGLVGLLGLVGAVFTFLDGQVTAAAIFLVASAVAFGLLAKALLGK